MLVQPSFEEGFGLPVLEAMTVGVPVVAANARRAARGGRRRRPRWSPPSDPSALGGCDRAAAGR